jgi:hypothetical protein
MADVIAWIKAQYWSRRDHRDASAGTADAGLPVALNANGRLNSSIMGATLTGDGTVATGGFTLTVGGNSTINGTLSGGGTVATAGFTLTVPATGTAAIISSDPWTPTIGFGGNAVGLTYSVQVGRYTRIGNIIIATGFVALSAKGSSTGAARIRTLPVASKNTANFLQPFFVRMDDMSGTSGSYSAFLQPNATEARLDFSGTGVVTEMTDAHFTNSSSIMIMAIYEV